MHDLFRGKQCFAAVFFPLSLSLLHLIRSNTESSSFWCACACARLILALDSIFLDGVFFFCVSVSDGMRLFRVNIFHARRQIRITLPFSFLAKSLSLCWYCYTCCLIYSIIISPFSNFLFFTSSNSKFMPCSMFIVFRPFGLLTEKPKPEKKSIPLRWIWKTRRRNITDFFFLFFLKRWAKLFILD